MTAPVALIFGSGKRRIGSFIAREAAQRGYRVALHYKSSADEAQRNVEECLALGAADCISLCGDVTLEADVIRIISDIAARWGRIDLLVTAASVWDAMPLATTTSELLRQQWEVNTLGTFLGCQHGGAVMIKQPQGGLIITIADWAITRPYSDYAAYFVSKGAIPTLTLTFANELARQNPAVRVNCISPGPVMVPEDMPEEEREKIRKRTLVKRLGTPDHIVRAVFALVENDFITGVNLPVDGGRTAMAD